jgi:erythromycin esterase
MKEARQLSIFVSVVAAILLGQFECWSQPKDDALKSLIRGVVPISPASTFREEGYLPPSLFEGAAIIGVGEATHGTHEFFEVKSRLLQLLVESHGVKVLVTESYFTNTDLNSYVLHGIGNPCKAIFNMGYGFLYTEEMLDVVEWIKHYNDAQNEESKIRMYGCDIPIPKFITPVLYDFLVTSNELTEAAESTLQMVNAKTNRDRFDRKEEQSTRELLATIERLLEGKQGRQNEWISRHRRLLEQYLEMSLSPDKGLRDKYMAENALWIRTYEENAKMMIWAHNGHVSKAEKGILNRPMGWHLRKQLKDDYYAIGLGFGSGELHAANLTNMKAEAVNSGDALSGSLDALFSEAEAAEFFLNINGAQSDLNLKKLLSQPVLTKNIGETFNPGKANSYYRKVVLSENYDGYVFIRNTSATKRLSYDELK